MALLEIMHEIITIIVTPFSQNARVVFDAATDTAIVVDPGGDIPQILEICKTRNATVVGIVLTHSHIDHAGGVKRMLSELEKTQKVKPLLYAHPEERLMRSRISDQALMFGLSPLEYENCPEPDVYIEEGSKIKLGEFVFSVLETPGHSPGHVSLLLARGAADKDCAVLFGGDVLFQGSIGRTDLPGGNFQTLIESIKNKILTLPDDTVVLSGHGPNTTVGHERRSNPFLSEV